jgi:hypothetical protein
MASQLTAAVFAAAANAVAMKQAQAASGAVSIPYQRGSDLTVSRNINPIDHRGFSAPVSTQSAPRPAAQASTLTQQLSEVTSNITPALLAKHYLPGILLNNGPLAIRYITAHLIASLPGFSAIPPAKQRRLVVGALEGRGGCSGIHGEVGGVDGDVIFEKVGWGRWDARRKGDPPRTGTANVPISPLMSATQYDREALAASYQSQTATSYQEAGIFVQSEEEDVDMEDARSEASSDTSEDDDMTDEEDWAGMGAAALRRHGVSPITSDGWNASYTRSPSSHVLQWPESAAQKRAREEREAVEALVKLSSI